MAYGESNRIVTRRMTSVTRNINSLPQYAGDGNY